MEEDNEVQEVREESEDEIRGDDMGEGFEKDKGEEEKKVKKPRKPLFKISPDYLIDNPNGLKALYKMFVVDNKLKFKGKGNEFSDFNKVMNLYKNWHYQAGLKLEFPYFIERVQKTGGDKAIKTFMTRLRKHFTGEELMDEMQTVQQTGNEE